MDWSPSDRAGRSLLTRIELAASRTGTVTFVNGDHHDPVTYRDLHIEARAMAAALQDRGIRPGDHVSILGPTTRPLVTAIQGAWLAGACVVVLPLPMRMGSIDEFIAQTRTRIRNADSAVVLADPELAAFITPDPDDPPLVTFDELAGDATRYVRPDDDPDRLAILQFTSGSTSDPKGVMLPHRCVTANVDAIAAAADLDVADDVLISWLPLYHDMGLIGLLTMPLCTGADLVLAAPQDFLARPARWMEWFSAYGGTATAGPNFSWVLAARALRSADTTFDLSRMRVALNGAEPVDPDTVEAFIEAGRRHGLRPGAVFPAFGMAEATLAVTFPPPMRGLQYDPVERAVLEKERYAAPATENRIGTRRLAKLGTPVPGLEIRVVDPDTGRPCGEREVGELEIRGESVTPGYYGNPEATSAAFRDGWLRTGDLAYLVDGELVVCGRLKDVIIIGGRNVFPEDVERAVNDLDGVRAGNVIAFGVSARKGKEAIVVVAESRTDDPSLVAKCVAERVADAVGVPPKQVVLVRPGTLPKTSSGKLQRSRCKQQLEVGELDVLQSVSV